MRKSRGDFTLVYKGCNTFDIYFALINLSARSLKAYGDPNRRSEERNAWIEYLATECDDSILGPEEVDIHE